jgi:AcrR family transcriptional regulator
MPRAVGVKAKVERAALELFAANGLDGVSIADIAAAAGVSQGALYRHYPSKEELAWTLFSTAYLRTGEELDALRADHLGLEAGIRAMVAHFCALYDDDPALFRFMLLTQHGLLPRIASGSRTPVDAIADLVRDASVEEQLNPLDPSLAAAVIMGAVLQPVTFHIYGRLQGVLSARAPALSQAAIAAVRALSKAG